MKLAPELEAPERADASSAHGELRLLVPERAHERRDDAESRGPQDATEAPPAEVTRTVRRSRLRALEGQRIVDWLTLRLAPAGAAGLIAYSHMHELGEGLIVLAAVLAASQLLVNRAHLPLDLMPAGRIVLGLAAPVMGGAVAWLAAAAVGHPY